MTQYIKGSRGNNRKDHVLIRQYDNESETIITEPMTLKQALQGMLYFENKGYQVLKVERIKK